MPAPLRLRALCAAPCAAALSLALLALPAHALADAAAADMVQVPAGPFWMGCGSADRHCAPDEEPARTVSLDAFWIDRAEVTVAQYRACVVAGACRPPRKGGERDNWDTPGRDDHPINAVSWLQAHTYCAWAGKRLPTEAEWEKAARGASDQRRFPWGGGDATCDHAHLRGCEGDAHTLPVGSRRDDASPVGALDMAGNVREWVADWYANNHDSDATRNPKGPAEGDKRVLKGGSFFQPAKAARVSARGMAGERVANFDVGFRCAKAASAE
jgi:formylglycine-generating enzyme required for sulfatase activity